MTDTTLPAAPNPPEAVKQPPRPKLREILGPGLITGASDDDPSGIATYSQAGAQYGYQLGWTMLFSWPLMCAIQEISARIGRVTGRGIAGILKKHYPMPILYGIVSLLVVANTINLAADLGAMAAALKLLIGGPSLLYVVGFAILTAVLETFVRYSRYVSVLKWLTISLFAYVGAAFVVHVPWGAVAYSLVVPKISIASDYLTVVVAIFGTTISPYLFFWQAEEEVEDERERPGAKPLVRAPEQAARRVPSHPDRHLSRDGPVQPGRAVHHDHGGGHAECERHHGHPDLVPGRRSATPGRGTVRVPDLLARHHRHRPADRCRCWRARPPMPLARLSAGTSVSRANPPGPSASTSRSPLSRQPGPS